MSHTPTPEQDSIIDLFQTGDSMVVEAGAGTGKTSTLVMIGNASPRRGRYLAFNKSIVTEASAKMPDNVAASTSHSLAFRTTGKQYAHRLNTPRMASWQLAHHLGTDPIVVTYGSEKKVLQPGYLASLTMRALDRFCQSADDKPGTHHFPYIDGIDVPNGDGTRTHTNNRLVRDALYPGLVKAWDDRQRVDGQLKFTHDAYLKIWALTHPHTDVDFILLDEAQDTNPVLAQVVADQTHAQRILVGDACQAIYEWRGATNAMAEFDESHRRFLSHSFRFGPEIAGVANSILGLLAADLRITGVGAAGEVGILNDGDVDAILCRTNAEAVTQMLRCIGTGRRPHLVGGGKDVLSFAEGADKLQKTGETWHPELACFTSWQQVQDYVDNDPQGSDLKLLVKLIDDFGVATIKRALDQMPTERAADLVISTAHKAKGREWDRVKIASDFQTTDTSEGELRLMYVAATRARRVLDDTAIRAAYAPKPEVVKPDPIAMPARTDA